jgi:hypothetical protein
MSKNGQVVFDEIKALPPEEQREVFDGVAQLQDRYRRWEEQKVKLRQMQAEFAGKGLLETLLAERAKERAQERGRE